MPKEQMMTLGALRKRMQWSQSQVAGLLNISKETIMKWEKDASEMPVKYMYEFETLYNYPMNGIFFGDSIALSESLKGNNKEL